MAAIIRQWTSLIRSRLGIGVILIVLALFIHYSQLGRPIENALVRMIAPIQARLFAASEDRADTAARQNDLENLSHEELIEQHIQLQEQVQDLQVENVYLQTVVQEAKLLETQQAFLKESSFSAVPARVISRSTEALSQTIVVNAGSVAGVQEGMPVIFGDGILIGTVDTVADYYSTVLLVTSFDSRVSAQLQNTSQSPGVVRGAHNLSLQMEFIPQLDAFEVGDGVSTNGADQLIPNNLILGVVEEVVSEPGSLFQEAQIAPAFRPSELHIVSIILP